MTNIIPVLTGQGRVFINVAGPGCGNTYRYHSCMKVDSVDKSFGDVTPVYCPDPDRYDEFIEIASVRGGDSRPTSTLSGILPINEESVLEMLSRDGCSFDIQVHYGRCTRPDDFNRYDSAIILEDVRLTSYGLSSLTASTPDERATVQETAAISIGQVYRILPQKNVKQAQSVITASMVVFGITNADYKTCGGICSQKSSGCDVWIAGVYDGTDNVSFLITSDGGLSWSLVDANVAALHDGNENAANIITSGAYTYFTVEDDTDAYIYRASNSSIFSGTPDSIELFSSVDINIYDVAESDNYIWMGGGKLGNSYIIAIDKSNGEVTEIYNTSTDEIIGISAYDDDTVVATGQNGVVLYSVTFGNFSATSVRPTNVECTSTYIIAPNNWLVAGNNGIYCTGDGGATWKKVLTTTSKTMLGFYSPTIGYAIANKGVFRTIDSGNTWTQVDEMVFNNAANIQACAFNANIYFASGGTAGNSFIVKGS